MDALVNLTLAAAIGTAGPALVSDPYLGSPTPTHCEFQVDRERVTLPIEIDEQGAHCRMDAGGLSEGRHVARARFLILAHGRNPVRGPWNNPRDFWVAKVDDASFWSWENSIKCGQAGCVQDR